MREGERDTSTGQYDRMLALNTATRLRRAYRAGDGGRYRTPASEAAEAPHEGDQHLLKESLDVVAPAAAELVGHFYATLFHHRPHLRELFPIAMDIQRDRLLHALLAVVGTLDQTDLLVPLLEQLGRDHRKFGVRPVHYGPVGDALIAALKHFAGSAWTTEYEAAWLRAYVFAADVMTRAADAAEPDPPYWHAAVVGHDVRRPDLAVITLKPDSPYPYQPGQFTTMESPRRPRTWRPYSIANAPRQDGSLELHVRMVGAGWVSRALVRQTAVGDTVRIGPPVGAMTLDAVEHGRPLLFIGGGTGIAPMRAMLESMSTSDGRDVIVVVAAREPDALYDLTVLSTVVSVRPRVTLIVAVEHLGRYGLTAAGSGGSGTWVPAAGVASLVVGRADRVLADCGDLQGREAFVAGPPAMVRACLAALPEVGIGSVHYDLLGA